jgi:ComF family protein
MATTLDSRTAALLFPAPPRTNSARGLLRACADSALDLLFPPHCAACAAPLPGGVNKVLCRGCAERINWLGANRCRRCGDGTGLGSGVTDECASCKSHPPAFVRQSCCVARYAAGPVRNLVLALKFGGRLHVAKLLGALLARRVQETGLRAANLVLAPAPLMRRRDFNQAGEIARWAAQSLGAAMEPRLLRKVRATPPQATLSHEQRRLNLKGAFVCDKKIAARHRERCILLVDDVITTGSTVSECARVLREAGVSEVNAAAFARG